MGRTAQKPKGTERVHTVCFLPLTTTAVQRENILDAEDDKERTAMYQDKKKRHSHTYLHLKWNRISCRDQPFDNSGRTGSNFHPRFL